MYMKVFVNHDETTESEQGFQHGGEGVVVAVRQGLAAVVVLVDQDGVGGSRNSNRRVSISRPAPRPKPAPKPAPKPKPSGVSAWFGGSRSRGSSSRTSNGSGTRRSGWGWGRASNRRGSISRSAPRPKPAPKPASKPKLSRGWWRSRTPAVSRIPVPKPKPKPKPKILPKPKPSGWLWSRKPVSKIPVPKPKLKPPVGSSIKNPNYIPYKEKTFKHPEDTKGVIKAFETHGGEPNLKMYNAKTKNMKNDPTIGYGFSLNRPDARKTFKTVLPGANFDKVKAGTESIKKEDAKKLFNHDVDKIYQPKARNRLGANVFDKLPSNVKTAVVNAQYRGDLGPKTVGYIQKGEWNKVSTEYLDHKGYKNASKNNMNGIVQRMNWNAKQFDSMTKNG
ncbi:serine/arginine repetitive matrix protein 1-like [Mytilus californianus]|uniref:serine/arginine repetitive matrix protein 1-like n=1 Tax=Mytilus californianus TaxID=6549 RepID=UPI0022461710|nr:serine/arginine repetitive matrix protein 1-like [Mytilus californianus]